MDACFLSEKRPTRIYSLFPYLSNLTIKAKSLQFSAEGSSVPDHIRLYQQETGKDVVGVFCAPTIHERNTAAMKSTIAPYGIELHCITDKELVELLLTKDREKIKKM